MISDLKDISLAVSNFEYSQAGGGNTSVKKGNMMHIKASGFMLSEMTLERGYVSLDYTKIVELFENHSHVGNDLGEEGEISKRINALPENKEFRPSMEASMHAFLGTHVAHTHPLYVNILNCMEGGEELLREILGEMYNLYFVPYVSPGYNLGHAIFELSKEMNKGTSVIFLQNHGLIVTGENKEEVIRVHNDLCERVKNYLVEKYGVTPSCTEPTLTPEGELSFSSHPLIKELDNPSELIERAMFPDFVVFSQKSCSIVSSVDEIEITSEMSAHIFIVPGEGAYFYGSEKRKYSMHVVLIAVLFILDGIAKIGTPRYLSLNHVEYLCNMDSEKYRKKLIS